MTLLIVHSLSDCPHWRKSVAPPLLQYGSFSAIKRITDLVYMSQNIPIFLFEFSLPSPWWGPGFEAPPVFRLRWWSNSDAARHENLHSFNTVGPTEFKLAL